MFYLLLTLHSLFRWLVLGGLLWAIIRSAGALRSHRAFNVTDNRIRHWSATVAHVQLMIGILLYTQSATVKISGFFGVVHLLAMILAILLITLGSALSKRKENSTQKFRTLLNWYAVALVLILAAIPWPFLPWGARPLIRW